MKLLRALGLGLLLSGCGFGNRAVASRADYAAYRKTHTEPREIERLAAADSYLREHRDGRFRREVRAYYARNEARFFRAAYNHPSQLTLYVRHLPEGPHASAARARLDEFALLKERRARKEREQREQQAAIERGLKQAEIDRRAFVQELVQLAGELAATPRLGQALTELSPELRQRVEPTGQLCGVERCEKHWQRPFGVPASGGLHQQNVPLRLDIELTSGATQALIVSGPQLFSHIAEALDRKRINSADWQERTEAIGRAVQLLENAVEARLPAAECRQDPVAPWVVVRQCRGLLFRAAAGLEPGQPDRFEMRAAQASSTSK